MRERDNESEAKRGRTLILTIVSVGFQPLVTQSTGYGTEQKNEKYQKGKGDRQIIGERKRKSKHSVRRPLLFLFFCYLSEPRA